MPNELAGVNLKHPQFTGFLTKRSSFSNTVLRVQVLG